MGGVNFQGNMQKVINPDNYAKLFEGLGLPLKVTPYELIFVNSTANVITTGIPIYTANYVQNKTVISGVCWLNGLAANFTPVDFNGVALYRLDGDIMTLVAISANDPNIWATVGVYSIANFLVPYNCPGNEMLYAAMLFNSSLTVQAPQLRGFGATPSAIVFNNKKLSGTSAVSPSFPVSLDITLDVTSNNNYRWLALV
jgi:hypothetical protein